MVSEHMALVLLLPQEVRQLRQQAEPDREAHGA